MTEFNEQELQSDEPERVVIRDRATKQVGLGVFVLVLSAFIFMLKGPQSRMFMGMLGGGLVVAGHGVWILLRSRQGSARPGEVLAPMIRGRTQTRWYELRPGAGAELAVSFDRPDMMSPFQMVRVMLSGQEVDLITELEGTADTVLPDGSILTLRVVPDFRQHRRLVVELEGLALDERSQAEART